MVVDAQGHSCAPNQAWLATAARCAEPAPKGFATAVEHCPSDGVRAHAARMLGCPAAQITVREVMVGREHNPEDLQFAEGCGQRVVYIWRPWSNPREWVVIARFALGPTR